MTVTLILVRHAKSDWGAGVPDRARPLSDRGVRQAPATGEWIGSRFGDLGVAVVSTAERAQQTWRLLSAHLDPVADTIDSEDAYTFDGEDLADVVRALPSSAPTALLVGHNPALEELIHLATGKSVPMPTAALAVLELPGWESIGDGAGAVVAAGRPADGRWAVRPL